MAGQRLGSLDERNGWPWTFAVIDTVKPRWFLAENVLGWTYHRDLCGHVDHACPGCYWEGYILAELARRFPFTGSWRLDAADFGVPQRRRRVILWGGPLPLSADGPPPSHTNPLEEDALLKGRKPWMTLSEAIGDTLLDPMTCETRTCYPCTGSHGRACTESWRLGTVSPTVTTAEEKGTRANSQADWSFNGGPDRASDTTFLVAGVRRIEVHEGLLLQGFPADWPIQGTRHDQYMQVGNAVPPALAEVAGRSIRIANQIWLNLYQQGVATPALTCALRRNHLTISFYR
jgi:site-specific DNA-cytosine methylase